MQANDDNWSDYISEQKCDVVHGVGRVCEEVVDANEVGLLAHASVVLVPNQQRENRVLRYNENHLKNKITCQEIVSI